MNCKNCHNDLIFYIEGTLSEDRIKSVETHLHSCEECASFAAYLTSTLKVIGTEKEMKPSPFLYTRIKARLEQEQQEKTSRIWQKVWQPALFSLMLLLGIYSGIRLGREFSPETPQDYITMDIAPLLNEMSSEPMELFLIY